MEVSGGTVEVSGGQLGVRMGCRLALKMTPKPRRVENLATPPVHMAVYCLGTRTYPRRPSSRPFTSPFEVKKCFDALQSQSVNGQWPINAAVLSVLSVDIALPADVPARCLPIEQTRKDNRSCARFSLSQPSVRIVRPHRAWFSGGCVPLLDGAEMGDHTRVTRTVSGSRKTPGRDNVDRCLSCLWCVLACTKTEWLF